MAHKVRKENDNGPIVAYFDRNDLQPIDPADSFASWMIPLLPGGEYDHAGRVTLDVENPVIMDLSLSDGTVIPDGQVKLDITGFEDVVVAPNQYLEFGLEVELLAGDGLRETHPESTPYTIIRINRNQGDQ